MSVTEIHGNHQIITGIILPVISTYRVGSDAYRLIERRDIPALGAYDADSRHGDKQYKSF